MYDSSSLLCKPKHGEPTCICMEYIEAFHPLTLILITYICIKQHDHNFRAVVLLWKPLHRCFAYFRRSWDSEASVVNAFATFLLLSFTKILFVSFTLLKCITCCQFKRWYALHTFMETFQGQYKDGTNGTRDFRIVSALYLIFRITVLLTYSDSHHSFDHVYAWVAGVVFFISTLLFLQL